MLWFGENEEKKSAYIVDLIKTAEQLGLRTQYSVRESPIVTVTMRS